MPHRPSARAAGRRLATAALSLLLATGCASRRVPAPAELAREVARAEAVGPGGPSPSASGEGTSRPPGDERSGLASARRGAEPPSSPLAPRTLADLVDLALANDPATRGAWHDARAAAAQAGARWASYLPTLDVNAAWTRQRQTAGPVRGPVEAESWGPAGTLSWLLVDLGARGALREEGELLLAAARLAEHAAVADLVLRVQQAYFGYLGARALVEAQTAVVRQAEASLAAAEARQRTGVATVADVLQARTALSQSRLSLQQLEGQALALRGGLASLAGLRPTAELDVGVLPAAVDVDAARPAVDALLEAAQAKNPDVQRAEAIAAAAGARARAATRALGPTLSFQGSRSVTYWLDPSSAERTTAWSASLVLRLPLLEGLGLRPAYDALAARASAEAARARAEATGQRVALDVWTSWQATRTAALRVGTSRDLVGSARASAEVAQGRYREGVGSILDLLSAQAALAQALAEEVRARADFLVALAQLARASGRLDLPGGSAPDCQEGPRTP